jgi:hypothetical protein
MLRRVLDSAAFRGPQIAAAGLLLIYLLQCVWLVHVQVKQALLPDSDQALRMYQGIEQWKGGAMAGTPESLRAEAATGVPSAGRAGHLRVLDGFDQDRSPLYYLLAAVPLLLPFSSRWPEWLGPFAAPAPQMFFGVMLGASLWYVARRLYGNAGGYIALALYCFSPAIIANTVGAQSLGEMGALWGSFGIIFTGIAVAHTLYAPREVLIWNWRRILLLGLSMALAVGNQFSLVVLVLIILPIMFWVAPVRTKAALAVWTMAIAVAGAIIFAAYSFEPALLWQGMLHARWINFEPAAFSMRIAYGSVVRSIMAGSPPLILALPVALVAYFSWKRARYFGNTIPLLIAILFVILTLSAARFPGQAFRLGTVMFLFVFVAGLFADLLETQHSELVAASLWGVLGASALWNVWQLLRL